MYNHSMLQHINEIFIMNFTKQLMFKNITLKNRLIFLCRNVIFGSL